MKKNLVDTHIFDSDANSPASFFSDDTHNANSTPMTEAVDNGHFMLNTNSFFDQSYFIGGTDANGLEDTDANNFVDQVLKEEDLLEQNSPQINSHLSSPGVHQSPAQSPRPQTPYVVVNPSADPHAIQQRRRALTPIPLSSLNSRNVKQSPKAFVPVFYTDSESSQDSLGYSSEDTRTQEHSGGKQRKKRKGGPRGPYTCGRCGQPKKGHKCNLPDTPNSKEDENSSPSKSSKTNGRGNYDSPMNSPFSKNSPLSKDPSLSKVFHEGVRRSPRKLSLDMMQ